MKLWQIVLAVILLGSAIFASCRFPVVHVDDYSRLFEAQETAVYFVLAISESGEVVAEGNVIGMSSLGNSCSGEKGGCYFSMDVEGVNIFVHYLLDPNRPDCLNTKASEQAIKVRNGDRVRVFGEYFGYGNISTCGSNDYYIEILPSEN